VASKRRFGLFSQPLSTAIGDGSPYKQKLGNLAIIKFISGRMENPLLFQETSWPVQTVLESAKRVLLNLPEAFISVINI
jgi:hypothetical protein